ncbi:MAG TPA: DUF6600 domain-containing protein [Candidatus Baltobacteraceae bacterium]|nr:DUF6600 domain-containing protein [Candidatus Baltobacteraceae bacterium]
MHKRLLGTVLAVAILPAGVLATTAPSPAQTYPGGSGVANVSVANGDVTVVREDSGEQVAAMVNAPVLPGDYVATGSNSEAEVQFDGISMLRFAPNTQVRFIRLDPGAREMQLASGTVDLAELQGIDGSPQVDTPSVTVRPNQRGDYRVSVLGNGQTLVTVRSGSATIADGSGARTLTPGTTVVASGQYSNAPIETQRAIGYDTFDQFNAARDQSLASAYNSNPYLSPQLAGYSNFANYGQWHNVAGYGEAWAPNNQAQNNFAPYQNGQWVWEPGYGYTWVDNQPWGYAPSHYGNWFYNSNQGGWLWQPPAYQNQVTSSSLASSWLPALVAFFVTGGGGNGLLSSLVSGAANPNYDNANIGWIPLAPGEQYQPWYGQNASYPPTSVTNVTNVYNYYGNARYYRGVTMVPVRAWRAGDFRHPVIMRPQQLGRVALIRGGIPVVPTNANLHYSHLAARRTVALSRTFATPRFAEKAPNAARVKFAAQQAQIRALASKKPTVVSPPPRIAPTHPVYRPVAHAPVPALKMERPAPHAAVHTPAPRAAVHTPAPHAAVHTMKPAEPVKAPHLATHAPAAPARVATPRPVVHPATPRPVIHTAPPVERVKAPSPVVHPTVPVMHPATSRPVMIHTAPPAAHVPVPIAHPMPVTRPAPPRPVIHTVPPVPVEHHVVPQAVKPPQPAVTHAAPPKDEHSAKPHPAPTNRPPGS